MMHIFFRRGGLFFLLFASLWTASADAGAVFLRLVVDPPTTAGFGVPTIPRDNSTGSFSVTSNKSGPGSFHLYALDAGADSFGIAYFQVGLFGGVTSSSVLNRSPIADFDTLDDQGNSVENASGHAGFSLNLLRSGVGSNPRIPVQGAQDVGSVYRIGGLGQTASNFNNTPNLPAVPAGGIRAWSGITSGAWGNYATDPAPYNGKSWLLLGEGNYTGNLPSIDFGSSTKVLYYASADFNSQKEATTNLCLACYPPTVQDVDVNNVIANDPGLLTLTMSLVPVPPPPISPLIWSNFTFDSFVPAPGESGTGPTTPATFNTSSRQFSWNTVGSPLGTYKWLVTATNDYGADVGSITVHITAVPEPATITLLGFALAALYNCNRRRR